MDQELNRHETVNEKLTKLKHYSIQEKFIQYDCHKSCNASHFVPLDRDLWLIEYRIEVTSKAFGKLKPLSYSRNLCTIGQCHMFPVHLISPVNLVFGQLIVLTYNKANIKDWHFIVACQGSSWDFTTVHFTAPLCGEAADKLHHTDGQ